MDCIDKIKNDYIRETIRRMGRRAHDLGPFLSTIELADIYKIADYIVSLENKETEAKDNGNQET